MERQHEPELINVRNQLLGLERNRLHAHRHDLFWNAAQWQASFTRLIECEQHRDNEYLQALTSVPLGSAEGLFWLQTLYDAIEHDISWHQWLLNEVQAKQQSTEEHILPQQTQQELLDHYACVATWLRAREVRLNQVALEFLEGRRREQGSLPIGVWQRYWTQLQQAAQSQSQHWQQAYAQALPQSDLLIQLNWYKYLRDVQQTTRELWRAERAFDHKSWHRDRAQVDNIIRVLGPRRRLFGVWMAVASVGFVALYFASPLFGEVLTPNSMSTSSTTPLAALRSAPEMNEQGLVLLVRGDCAGAVPLFQRASELDPTYYQPPNNLAFCLFDQGSVSTAIMHWRRSVELNPANADGHAGLGMALYHTGLFAEGQAEYQAAMKLDPRYGDEAWLRNVAKWSEHAINASNPLRLRANH